MHPESTLYTHPQHSRRPSGDLIDRAIREAAARKRAAIYCRVSTPDQALEDKDKVSLAEQLADCEAYCAEHGYEVVARYQDIATGSTSKRPDF